MPDSKVPVRTCDSLSVSRKATGSVHGVAAIPFNKTAPHFMPADSVSGSAGVNQELSTIIHKFVRRGDCVVELGCRDGSNLRCIATATGDGGR